MKTNELKIRLLSALSVPDLIDVFERSGLSVTGIASDTEEIVMEVVPEYRTC